jgi:hypothetical protein
MSVNDHTSSPLDNLKLKQNLKHKIRDHLHGNTAFLRTRRTTDPSVRHHQFIDTRVQVRRHSLRSQPIHRQTYSASYHKNMHPFDK